ncbi:hypothetical protein [Accumulibacter sp.]|uniref:hypothetical protein n=1 Tax=Accumulibacter sp. TaxID=2053492 RepID=UPI001A4A04B1|nr:hypothetical protein [Accumulibacter sp.]MBL8375623.1 hypothetical protein [Accumulibacter sp.]
MLPVDLYAAPPSLTRSLAWAFATSLVVHAVVLLLPEKEPVSQPVASSRFEASLSPGPPADTQPTPARPRETATRAARAPAKPAKPATQPAPRPRVMTVPKPAKPAIADSRQWSRAQKEEMTRFLDELATEAKAAPKPSLAQRSLAQARDLGRQRAQQDAEGTALLERRPNTPPPEPFSLDLYVDSVVRRLNRSAAFVRNDPRSRGVKTAAVQFRINPDGSLKSFKVLNAGDQEKEIAFIRSVVERSIPFGRFPPDIERAARSLGITICIQPSLGGGFGFTRMGDGRPC